MDVQLTAGSDIAELLGKVRKASPAIRRELSASIKKATTPLETDLKAAVMGLASKGVAGGGHAQRSAHSAGRSARGLPTKQTGLRKNIAKGVTRKITLAGYRTGVRVKVDTKYLPANQRGLPKLMNKGSWRHPAGYGRNRGSVWVAQTVTPKGWWDNTVKIHAPKVIAEIEAAATKAVESALK